MTIYVSVSVSSFQIAFVASQLANGVLAGSLGAEEVTILGLIQHRTEVELGVAIVGCVVLFCFNRYALELLFIRQIHVLATCGKMAVASLKIEVSQSLVTCFPDLSIIPLGCRPKTNADLCRNTSSRTPPR